MVNIYISHYNFIHFVIQIASLTDTTICFTHFLKNTDVKCRGYFKVALVLNQQDTTKGVVKKTKITCIKFNYYSLKH